MSRSARLRGAANPFALAGLGRRAELPIAAVLVAVLAAIAFAATAGSRLLERAEADSLAQAVAEAPASDRRLSISRIGDFPAGSPDDPLADPSAAVGAVAADIDPELLARYGPPRLVVDTNRFAIDAVDEVTPSQPSYLTLRVHPELDDHSTITVGRPAAPTDRVVDGRRVVEFEVSSATATELGWDIGTVVGLTIDATDLVTRQATGGLPDDFVAELVGVRDLAPVDDPYWSGDVRLHRPTVSDTVIGATVFAFGSIAPDQLPDRPFLASGTSPFLVEQRRDLLVGAVDVASAPAMLDALTALAASFDPLPTLTRPGVVAGLGDVLALEREQRTAARATLLLAAAGTLGVAVTALGQLLAVVFGRRRGWVTVARARGAGPRQVIAGAVVEMTVVTVVALVVGWAAAALAFVGDPTGLEIRLLSGLAVGALACAAALGRLETRRPIVLGGRSERPPGAGRWGRVAGALLVVATVAAVVTLRRRGVAIGTAGADPLVVLVPVLVPLAIVHLTRPALPYAVGRVADAGLAVGPGRLVGLRRVATAPAATVGLVAVLVLASTVAALGLAVDRSIEAGAVDASWQRVGAAYRVDTRDGEARDAIARLPGVVVAASGTARLNLRRGDAAALAQVTSVDTVALAEITAGSVADPGLPPALAALDADGRIPVVAANRVGSLRIRPGDVLAGAAGGTTVEYSVVETRAEAFGRTRDWIVLDRSTFGVAVGAAPGFSSLAIGGDETVRDELAAIATDADAELESRADVLADLSDDPLPRLVRRGYLLVGVLAVALGLLALVSVAVVTARQRSRDVAILGLLGAGPREIGRAVAAELLPPLLAGAGVGAGVGWLVVRLLDGRFDLSAFAGGSPVEIAAGAVAIALVAAVLVAAGAALVVVLARRIVAAPVHEILRTDGAG